MDIFPTIIYELRLPMHVLVWFCIEYLEVLVTEQTTGVYSTIVFLNVGKIGGMFYLTIFLVLLEQAPDIVLFWCAYILNME